jgi:hypothetical protein
MESAGFKDKGKDFLKNLFSLLKIGRHQRRLKKTVHFLSNMLTNVVTRKMKNILLLYLLIIIIDMLKFTVQTEKFKKYLLSTLK